MPPRHLEVGVGVDVDVAVAGRGVEDRDLGDGLERRLQALAAARDDQVDQVALAGELAELLAPAARDRLDRALGERRLGDRLLDDPDEHGVRGGGRARPAQDGGIAALQAEGGGVDRHVRARLVDDRDDADRHPPMLHLDSALERPRARAARRPDRRARRTASTPTAIASIRSASSRSRSISASSSPASRPASRSTRLASRISAVRSRSRRASAVSAASLSARRHPGQDQRSRAGAAADLGHGFGCDRHGAQGTEWRPRPDRACTRRGCQRRARGG